MSARETVFNRPGGRRARREKRAAEPRRIASAAIAARYAPLTDAECGAIHNAALTLLEEVGMADATPEAARRAIGAGASMGEDGRLRFPRRLVEDRLAKAARSFTVHGRDPARDFTARSGEIRFCTGGAAVSMLEGDAYRPSTLADLYSIARLAETLDNLDWIARPVVATDIEDAFELDANTIYACAAGTTKHIATSFASGDHVRRLTPMLDALAGGDFAARPFCTVHATTVVSPMSFAPDSLDVAFAAIEAGMPVHGQTGPQAGATAPATLAGALAQTCAEGLATLCLVNIARPGHPYVIGNWSFVSDLRTGAFSGGGAEQALLGAASGQMSAFYGVPGGMGAGMSDSKLPDAQAGFEKALTVALAALSGGGFAFETAGMLASLLGASLEAMVIDDEMLGSIRRIARGIEVNDATLAVDVVREAVAGPGHFLGAAQTLDVMETEFVYPRIADRLSPADWEAAGGGDIRARAARIVAERLAAPPRALISPEADAKIRAAFPIRLPNIWSARS